MVLQGSCRAVGFYIACGYLGCFTDSVVGSIKVLYKGVESLGLVVQGFGVKWVQGSRVCGLGCENAGHTLAVLHES